MQWLEKVLIDHKGVFVKSVVGCGLTKQDAEDLIHDVALTLTQKRIGQPENPRAYFLSCLKRRMLDLLRKRSRELPKYRRLETPDSEAADAPKPTEKSGGIRIWLSRAWTFVTASLSVRPNVSESAGRRTDACAASLTVSPYVSANVASAAFMAWLSRISGALGVSARAQM